METTRNEMPEYAKYFFKKLTDYLDVKIYYFGSIQRFDYFPSSSDIDADIFTDNESSTITKMQNFLGIPRYDFRKFVYRLHKANKMVYGYKVKYEDLELFLFYFVLIIYFHIKIYYYIIFSTLFMVTKNINWIFGTFWNFFCSIFIEHFRTKKMPIFIMKIL